METGQQFSLWSVRIALLLWFLFAISWLRKNRNANLLRWTWTLAALFHVIHVLLAFAFFHEWSHAMAAEHTAQRTEEFTRINWSGGIWFNHAFMVVVLVESIVWWAAPWRVLNRSHVWNWLIYGFWLFMIVNAGVVFVASPVRWINLTGILVVVIIWIRSQTNRQHGDIRKSDD